ncbi:cytochrome P450 [Streptomyces sp. NPDC003691]
MTQARPGPPSLLWPEFETSPYPLYRRLRDDYPLLRDEPLGGWLVSRHRDVHRALRDPAISNRLYEQPSRRLIGPTFVGLDGAEHAAHRAVVSPLFRGRVLGERFVPVVEETARDLAAALPRRARVDLVAEFSGPLPVSVTVALLGLPRAHSPLFREWYEALLTAGGDYTGDPEAAAAGDRARRELRAYLSPVIAERRAAPGEDLISLLCAARVRGEPLDDERIAALCSLILVAGGESTEKALTLTIRNLLENPGQLAAVRADPSLLPRAFLETLRRDPPSQYLVKETVADIELSGGPVPAGEKVYLLLGAANRDPEVFRDPDAFDLFRTELDVRREVTGGALQVALGGGSHFCLGALLARAEVEAGVRALLDALPGLRYAESFSPVDTGRFLRAPAELYVDTRPAVSPNDGGSR